MKKFIIAATAFSLIASPAIASAAPAPHNAPQRQHITQKAPQPAKQIRPAARAHQPAKPAIQQVRQQNQQRKWRNGERFNSRYASNYRQISKPRTYGLREAPRGQQWVQSGKDAILITTATGIIAAIIANAIR
jgi:Ni/Co efflux regulator RcnB